MGARLAVQTWQGEGAVTLGSGPLEATFLPGYGFLCCSLSHDGVELLAFPRSLTEHRAGGTTAFPLLHPYANRLSAWGYTAAGRRVDLRGLSLPVDARGLPIHGNVFASAFDVTGAATRGAVARLTGRLDYGADAERLRAFPFPHELFVTPRVDGAAGALDVVTEVRASRGSAVPVSFGWHPYFQLPEVARDAWILRRPACERLELDARLIPTGQRAALSRARGPLGERSFDDHYALGTDRRFSLTGGGRRITLTFGRGYDFAQLYAPLDAPFVAVEPMTATIDALCSGAAPVVEAGGSARAGVRVRVERTAT
jgi:galactose mutarotase-like enzyme